MQIDVPNDPSSPKMADALTVTIGQINPTVGDIQGNVAQILRVAAEAPPAALVVFPELSLCGYYPGDLLLQPHFMSTVRTGLLSLIEANRSAGGQYWVIGAPAINPGQGKPFLNQLIVLHKGQIVLSYSKQLLPTYDIFDEARHFEPGPDTAALLRVGRLRVGFVVCEDAWARVPEDESASLYRTDPLQRLADAHPDLVVSINASPAAAGKRERRHDLFALAARRIGAPVLYVNQVGGQDQTVFDGASFLMNTWGRVEAEALAYAADVVSIKVSPSQESCVPASAIENVAQANARTPMETYRQQIVLGLRDYAQRCGFSQVVVGSSGGIDSALTLALAVEAMGAANVVAITMPSEYSSTGSVSDSEALCANLGVKLLSHPIRALVDQYKAGFAESTGNPLCGVALENLQARIRGTILMEYSNSFGHLLLTTGNKSEMAVGYCTLYGDTNGGLNLIGDLYKTEVFELSRHINEQAGQELIPVQIIEKAPSAELAPGQQDSDSLPEYPVLDSLLKELIEGSGMQASDRMLVRQVKQGFSSEAWGVLQTKIAGLMARSEYKRRQAPPVIKLRAVSFGPGRQVPIAAKHILGGAL